MNHYEVTVELIDAENSRNRQFGRSFTCDTKRVLQTTASEEEARNWAEIETGGKAIHCQFLDSFQE